MATPPIARAPNAHDMQTIRQLLANRQPQQAEQYAMQLLNQLGASAPLLTMLATAQSEQGQYAQAAQTLQKVVQLTPHALEAHFNLALMHTQLQQHEQAIARYRKVLEISPNQPVALYNLGTALQALSHWDEAAAAYRKATQLEPRFFEAFGNMGFVLQQQGKLEQAITAYQKALSINPQDALGHYNLGSALRNLGRIDDAMQHYRTAIKLFPNYADAYSNLADALYDKGDANAAFETYHQALEINPQHALANYGLAVLHYDASELKQAIPHFIASQHFDWLERAIYCLYKTEQYDEFKQWLTPALEANPNSPFLATLSTHYATNFGVADSYNFCPNPIDVVYHHSIAELAEPNSSLLAALLHDIQSGDIGGRMQMRLVNGTQSSGNLFKRPEASFKTLAELIKREVNRMREINAGNDCAFIRNFPKEIDFVSSWYVRMKSGGHLGSHIHEEGWVSGAVYLAIPQQKKTAEDGAIEVSTDGDNYPRRHDNFPRKAIPPQVGDIVMFPSSLFHRTIPFSSDEERICIAFDVRPKEPIKMRSNY